MNGKVFLLLGPSGVGKGTIERMLKERHPEFCYPLSVTTRSPRTGEQEGEVYHFVSAADFDAFIAGDKLLEWAVVHQTDRYGILKEPVVEAIEEGRVVIREVDVQGWRKILQSEIADRVVSIFILPPSLALLKQRIVKRSAISEEELGRRLQDVQIEIDAGTTANYHVVSEENMQEKAYAQVERIILDEMQK